jgi:hypothetical protein
LNASNRRGGTAAAGANRISQELKMAYAIVKYPLFLTGMQVCVVASELPSFEIIDAKTE